MFHTNNVWFDYCENILKHIVPQVFSKYQVEAKMLFCYTFIQHLCVYQTMHTTCFFGIQFLPHAFVIHLYQMISYHGIFQLFPLFVNKVHSNDQDQLLSITKTFILLEEDLNKKAVSRFQLLPVLSEITNHQCYQHTECLTRLGLSRIQQMTHGVLKDQYYYFLGNLKNSIHVISLVPLFYIFI